MTKLKGIEHLRLGILSSCYLGESKCVYMLRRGRTNIEVEKIIRPAIQFFFGEVGFDNMVWCGTNPAPSDIVVLHRDGLLENISEVDFLKSFTDGM